MRKKMIAANWKMNNLTTQTDYFFNTIGSSFTGLADREVLVAPSFPYIDRASRLAAGKNIAIAAQDFYPEENGAFTGEVSIDMFKDFGVNTVIIGHSERRHIMNEDFDLIRKKVAFAQKKGMRVIFCIGETLPQRQKSELFAVIEMQISTAFDNNLTAPLDDIVIAYEPVWAIGTGVNATGDQAQEMHAFIRKYMTKHYDRAETRILYGGSVKPDNVKDLMTKPDIDGVLVGGASLKPESFSSLVFFDR